MTRLTLSDKVNDVIDNLYAKCVVPLEEHHDGGINEGLKDKS